MDNIADALKAALGCKDDQELAALFDVTRKKPSDWRKANWLPFRHRKRAEDLCRERGVAPPDGLHQSSPRSGEDAAA